MTSEVIIDVQPKDISIALLEDKQLVEYQQEQQELLSLDEARKQKKDFFGN